MSEQIEMAKAAIEKNCKLNDIDVNLGQLQLSVDPANLILVIDFVKNDPSCEFKQITDTVSYTHLTLPTILLV